LFCSCPLNQSDGSRSRRTIDQRVLRLSSKIRSVAPTLMWEKLPSWFESLTTGGLWTSKIKRLTDRPERRRRAPIEFSHICRGEKSMLGATVESATSVAVAYESVNQIAGPQFFEKKRCRHHLCAVVGPAAHLLRADNDLSFQSNFLA
jgi:hypothetical protein